MPNLQNKKWWKRAVVGMGGMTTIIAPIVSTVAFQSNTTVENKINSLDTLKNSLKGYKAGLLTSELLNKVQGSDFYKSNLKKFTVNHVDINYWKINSNLELDKTLDSLATNTTTFSDQEKIAIASEIVNDFYVSNIMSVFGLDKNISNTYKAVQGSGTGISGFISDWHLGKSDQMSDRVFDLTGKDALAFYKSPSFISNQFVNLYRDADNFVNGDVTASNTIATFLTKWNGDIDKFYSAISFDGFSKAIGNVDSDFKVIQKFASGASNSDDEAYLAILKSPIAKKFFTDEGIANAEKTYSSTGGRGKQGLQVSLLSSITGYLLDLGQKSLVTFKGMVTSTSPFAWKQDAVFNGTLQVISNDLFASLMSFAKPLASFSKNGTSDVEIRIDDNAFQTIGSPSIRIRSSHNSFEDWSNISDTNPILVPQFVLGDSNEAPVIQTLNLRDGGLKGLTK